MKVTVKYEEREEQEFQMTLRLTLPAKYVSAPNRDLIKLFCDHYNKKHEGNQLDASALHLKIVGGDHLDHEERVRDVIKAGDELYLLAGSEMLPAKRAAGAAAAPVAASQPAVPDDASRAGAPKEKRDEEGRIRCKKFGCQKWFHEDHPPELPHHKGPPIFHEVAKWWSCCPDKKAYDFDEFMAIPGCEVSFCSNVSQGKRTMGGQDLRDLAGNSAPVRLDPNAPVDPMRKLDAMRKGLVAIGIEAALFEEAWKRILEMDGGNHEKAVEHFRAKFGAIMDKAGC